VLLHASYRFKSASSTSTAASSGLPLHLLSASSANMSANASLSALAGNRESVPARLRALRGSTAFWSASMLIAYYFMWHTGHPAPEQCEGCTWVTSQVREVAHDVEAITDCAFLLTIAWPSIDPLLTGEILARAPIHRYSSGFVAIEDDSVLVTGSA